MRPGKGVFTVRVQCHDWERPGQGQLPPRPQSIPRKCFLRTRRHSAAGTHTGKSSVPATVRPSITAGIVAMEPTAPSTRTQHSLPKAHEQSVAEKTPANPPAPPAYTHSHQNPAIVCCCWNFLLFLSESARESDCFPTPIYGSSVLEELVRARMADGYCCFSESLFKKQNAVTAWV